MNQLSIQAINESSSYEVSAVNDGCYQFFTDLSAIIAEFTETISLLSSNP